VFIQLVNYLLQVTKFCHHGHFFTLKLIEKHLENCVLNNFKFQLKSKYHDGFEACDKEAVTTPFFNQSRSKGLFLRFLQKKEEKKKGKSVVKIGNPIINIPLASDSIPHGKD